MKKILLIIFIAIFALANDIDIKKLENTFGLTKEQIVWIKNKLSKNGGGDIYNNNKELYRYLDILKEKGISIKEVMSWLKIDVANISWIEEVVKNKITPESYLKWEKALNVEYIPRDRLKNIKKFIQLGITPEIYKQYKGILNSFHTYDAEYMKKKINLLKKAKLKPNKLVMSIIRNYSDIKSSKELKKIVDILKKNNCKILETKYFNEVDEYDNEGKCYNFSAELIQRLSRYTGLAQGVILGFGIRGNVFFVTFNYSWKEGQYDSGIIKGEGSFKYRTVGGRTKIVPKGKVIY